MQEKSHRFVKIDGSRHGSGSHMKNDMFIKHNARVEVLIGDDDSSVIAALEGLSLYAIQKWSDFNHVKKTFDGKFYDMKLTARLREYFSKIFSMSVKENKGDAVEVNVALSNIVPHAFGDHQNVLTPDHVQGDQTSVSHKF